jgi:hypothetical protein
MFEGTVNRIGLAKTNPYTDLKVWELKWFLIQHHYWMEKIIILSRSSFPSNKSWQEISS